MNRQEAEEMVDSVIWTMQLEDPKWIPDPAWREAAIAVAMKKLESDGD